MEITVRNAKRLLTKELIDIIKNRLNVAIEVKEDLVVIEPMENTNPDSMIKARQIILAISLGFDANTALELLNDDKYLDLIDLSDYIGDKDRVNRLSRLKALIIGEGGKAKRNIEELTGTRIIIGEKVVSIIGDYEGVRAARDAIIMLINGKQHSTVYRWLQNWRRELNIRKFSNEDRWLNTSN